MANTETARNRAPRGTRPITLAFFAALEAIPEARRAEVAKAAQIAIRDELKEMKIKAKAAAPRKVGKPGRPAKAKTEAAPARATRAASTGRRTPEANAA